MNIREYLYNDWCDNDCENGQAVEAFYQEYIRQNNDLKIENAFLGAIVEESRRAFYAGIDTFANVMRELGVFNGTTKA